MTRDQFQLLDEITFKVELYSKNDRDNKTLDTALMYEPLRKKFADYKYAVVKDQPVSKTAVVAAVAAVFVSAAAVAATNTAVALQKLQKRLKLKLHFFVARREIANRI